MSIYSGFPTRKDEENYNKLLVKLLTTMQDHIIDLIQKINQSITLQRSKQYIKILTILKVYEERKYLSPKFSQTIQKLQSYIRQSHKLQFRTSHKFSVSSTSLSKTQYQKYHSLSLSQRKYSNNRQTKSSMKNKQLREQEFLRNASSSFYVVNLDASDLQSHHSRNSEISNDTQFLSNDEKTSKNGNRDIKIKKDGIKLQIIKQQQQNVKRRQFRKKRVIQNRNYT